MDIMTIVLPLIHLLFFVLLLGTLFFAVTQYTMYFRSNGQKSKNSSKKYLKQGNASILIAMIFVLILIVINIKQDIISGYLNRDVPSQNIRIPTNEIR